MPGTGGETSTGPFGERFRALLEAAPDAMVIVDPTAGSCW